MWSRPFSMRTRSTWTVSAGSTLKFWKMARNRHSPHPPIPDIPPNPDDDKKQDEQKYKLNVDVELVNVVATVLDENQKYMDGLRREYFKVLEDGQEQTFPPPPNSRHSAQPR